VIEAQAGCAVREIFERLGEAGFRQLELEATRELALRAEPLVVSPGGGWVANRRAVALLRPVGRIIHLRLSAEAAVARLKSDVAGRPLLAGPDPLGAMRRLAEVRQHAYQAADHVVDVEDVDISEVISMVVRLAEPAETP
jgi:shikimate kinase